MNPRRSFLPYLLLLVLFLPVAVVLLGLDLSPAVDPAVPAGVEDAARTRRLAKRAWRTLRRGGDSITLSVSEKELNSIAAFVDRGTGRVTARAAVDPGKVDGIVSLRLLQQPVAAYLNLSFTVKGADDGFELSRFRLGNIPLPGSLVLSLARTAIDAALGDGVGSDVLQCIRSMEVGSDVVTVTLCPLQQTSTGGIGLRQRLEQLRDRAEPFGDTELVALYFRRLAELDAQLPANGSVSLARFVGPLFAMARERGGNAAEENRAAILALASLLGSSKFEHLIGSVRPPELRGYRRRPRPVPLAGREDLRLHFLISAGLELISYSLATHTIGEFKELLDARHGGSGFSFADLAADRAGVHFAETATDRSGGAARLQETLSRGAEEWQFFPDVTELPEGLSRNQFERLFHSVESSEYLDLVEAIDRCIARLPAHSAGNTVAQPETSADCRVADVLPQALL